MPRIRYSAAVRTQAVHLVLESQTPVSHVARQFGCSLGTLQKWLKAHRQGVKEPQPVSKNSRQSDASMTFVNQAASPVPFIPVNLIEHKVTTIEIVTPDGFILKLADTNPQSIAELLGVLGSC